MTTEYECPVHRCTYRYRLGNSLSTLLSFMSRVPNGSLQDRLHQAQVLQAEQIDVVLREHFRCHALEDFLRTIQTQATQIENQSTVIGELQDAIRQLKLNIEMLARARTD